jgi:hypothetical protein
MQLTDGAYSGGTKILSFESFGTCPRSIGSSRIKHLIETFKAAPFSHPEYAILLINCDDDEGFNGTITLK